MPQYANTGAFGSAVYGSAGGQQHIAAPPSQAGGDTRRSQRPKRSSERNKSNRNKSQRGGKNKNKNRQKNKSQKNRQRGGK